MAETKGLFFDFKGVGDEGFREVPAGRYQFVTKEWFVYKKEETDNKVMVCFSEITDDPEHNGEFKGERIANFQTITPNSHGFVLSLMKTLGVIKDDDRKEDGSLDFLMAFGEVNDKGWMSLTHALVNGEKRDIVGIKGVAVMAFDKKADRVVVKTIEPAGNATASGVVAKQSKAKVLQDW